MFFSPKVMGLNHSLAGSLFFGTISVRFIVWQRHGSTSFLFSTLFAIRFCWQQAFFRSKTYQFLPVSVPRPNENDCGDVFSGKNAVRCVHHLLFFQPTTSTTPHPFRYQVYFKLETILTSFVLSPFFHDTRQRERCSFCQAQSKN